MTNSEGRGLEIGKRLDLIRPANVVDFRGVTEKLTDNWIFSLIPEGQWLNRWGELDILPCKGSRPHIIPATDIATAMINRDVVDHFSGFKWISLLYEPQEDVWIYAYRFISLRSTDLAFYYAFELENVLRGFNPPA